MTIFAPRTVVGASSIDRALTAKLAHAAELPLSYREIGATLSGETPSGYTPISADAVVGAGRNCFDVMVHAVKNWQIQTGSGIQVKASGPAAVDVDVALAKVIGPIGIVFACRVVRVVDEPRRGGFAYGTLPGHPEAGEEGFFVELDDDDAVTFQVRGFTRPGTTITTLAAPMARIAERQAILGYLRAARALVGTIAV